MKQKRDSILFEGEEVRTALRDRLGPFARVLAGEACNPPPIWLMRQAGRYLPEYREIRKNVGSFLDLCFNPKLATEVTLQPIRRFDFDAAILFSDILVIPHALQRNVRFVEGEGPRLDPIDVDDIMKMSSRLTPGVLDPIFETVASVREQLDKTKSLIGFCGAPWTVATYMVAGRGTPDQRPARMLASENPDVFRTLIDKLVFASTEYLIDQLRAGADVIQIFDTWAGVLSEEDFDKWCVRPTATIVSQVREAFPAARIIGFPKGAGLKIKRYVEETHVDAIGIDWTEPLGTVHDMIGDSVAIQGNLDPLVLLAGGSALDESIDRILDRLSDKRYIFNLGHGILPTTPIAHVERLVEKVRRGGTPT